MSERSYIAIDLKSFYASVECVERNLDPLNTNLVVADESRTEKTICLAVTPSLKAHGISGRARLFEVIQAVTTVNNQRRYNYRKQIIVFTSFTLLTRLQKQWAAVLILLSVFSRSLMMRTASGLFTRSAEDLDCQRLYM